MSARLCWLVLMTAIVVPVRLARAQATSAPKTQQLGTCEREGSVLIGVKPVRPGKGVRAPNKLRDVRPTYPEFPPQTRASGIWKGEVLLDTKGEVSRVWAIREVQFTPPFPAFNRAIADAIRQWEFEPLVLGKTPTPVCMTVTVNIDFQ